MQTVPKELDESRIYSPEQKARFIQCQATEGAKTEDRTEVVDVSQERKEMLRMFSRGGEVKGNLEWLGE